MFFIIMVITLIFLAPIMFAAGVAVSSIAVRLFGRHAAIQPTNEIKNPALFILKWTLVAFVVILVIRCVP
jgi:hypothetical protein